jgi:hypothetical protein
MDSRPAVTLRELVIFCCFTEDDLKIYEALINRSAT